MAAGERDGDPGYDGSNTTGFVSPAADALEGPIDLAAMLDLRRPHRYPVRVLGEALVDRGIYPGDVLIADTATAPTHGRRPRSRAVVPTPPPRNPIRAMKVYGKISRQTTLICCICCWTQVKGRMTQIGSVTAITIIGSSGFPSWNSRKQANASAMLGSNTDVAAMMAARQHSHGLDCGPSR